MREGASLGVGLGRELGERTAHKQGAAESRQECSGGRVPTNCAARWCSGTPGPGRPSAALEWGKAGGNGGGGLAVRIR